MTNEVGGFKGKTHIKSDEFGIIRILLVVFREKGDSKEEIISLLGN